MLTQIDDLFERSLEDLETGTPVNEIEKRLPPEVSELAPLLRLVAEIQSVEHPVLPPAKANVQRGQLIKSVHTQGAGFNIFKYNRRLFFSVGIAMIAVLLLGIAGFAWLLPTIQSTKTATLVDVSGIVEVAHAAKTDWQPVEDGFQIREGALIRTRVDSTATLVFFDGSRSTLDAGSEISLTHLKGGLDRSLQVQIDQIAGFTDHSVVPLRGTGSFYEVKTLSGLAKVHGTQFGVEVNPGGHSIFTVAHGKIEVDNAGASVFLTAGQATLVKDAETPEAPLYQFSIQGTLTAIQDDLWTVGGLTFQVNPDILNGLTFQIGDKVFVRGRILEDHTLVADHVSVAKQDRDKASFTGVVDAIGTDSWVIDGLPVKVNEKSEIDHGIKPGDTVEVSFTVLDDGSWLALEIAFVNQDEEPEGTPTSTAETTLTPTGTVTQTSTETVTPTADLTGTPKVEDTPTPETTPTIEPTLEGNRAFCESTDLQHPEGATLAERYQVPYREIMSWFCQGYGFGEIDLAYELSISYNKPVEEIFAMRQSGLGWGQIKQELARGTPSPTDQNPNNKPEKTKKPDKPEKTEKPDKK